MADYVIIGSKHETNVILRDPQGPDDQEWCYFVIELHSAGFDATTGVLTHQMNPLADFVRQLEIDWRGWDGARTWTSTEPGLTVTARHNRRRVVIQWTVGGDGDMPWRASIETHLAPGEELRALANDVGHLFAGM